MKTKLSILLFISLILILSFVNAQESSLMTNQGITWITDLAKSNKDPLYIEFTQEIHQEIPTKVILHINDENIKKNAKYIEISTSTARPYGITKPIHYDPSGNFRQTMIYNGEDKIEIGFRTNRFAGQTSSVSFTFYSGEILSSMEYPNTYDKESPYYGYNCGTETNKIFCGENQCMVCHKLWGSILREHMVSWSKESFSLPARFKFEDKRKGTNFESGLTPQYVSFAYSDEKVMTNKKGNEIKRKDTYSITLNIHSEYRPIEEQYQFLSESHNYKGWDFNMISAPGGITKGKAFEYMKYTPPKAHDGIEWFNFNYKLLTDLDPAGSGQMSLELGRETILAEGGSEAEKNALISEAKALASSFLISNDKIAKPDRELSHTYQVIYEKEEKEEKELHDYYVYGYIANSDKNGLPYMNIFALVNGQRYETKTTLNGDFEIKIEELDIKDTIEGRLVLKFEYQPEDIIYFELYNYLTNQYRSLIIEKKFNITKGDNTNINWVLNGSIDPTLSGNTGSYENIKNFAAIYYHMHEAVDFALNKLYADINHQLPIQVLVGQNDDETLYSPTNARIKIARTDMAFSSSNRPKNREYHEFGHHLMYAKYGGWTTDSNMPNTSNHDGFLNPSTADSFDEGFAEFIALAISDYHGYPNIDIYAGFGSLENNYKPWDSRGYLEEFAIASFLWDVYDKNNEPGDSLTMSIEDIWRIISVRRNNFYDYFVAFKERYPDKAKAFDDLAILHGFFADTREGNQQRDNFEPFRSRNNSQNYNEGDYFIDLSCIQAPCNITYQKGFKIGAAANYHRINRTQAVRVPGSLIKVDSSGPRYYTVKVTYLDKSLPDYEYEIERINDAIYLNPMPDNANANIEIIPNTKEFSFEKPFTISNKEFVEKRYQTTEEYFTEHDFKVKRIAEGLDPIYLEDYEPITYSNDDRRKEDIVEKLSNDYEDNLGNKKQKNKSKAGLFLLILLLVGGIIFVYINKNKLNFSKKEKTNLKSNKKTDFKSKFILFLKKVKIFLINFYNKAKPIIIKYSKKTYYFLKPKIIWLLNKIKDFIIWLYNKIKSLFDKKKEIKHKSKKNKK
jgi:hypothetical protein